jgi:hypothetical protein
MNQILIGKIELLISNNEFISLIECQREIRVVFGRGNFLTGDPAM